MQGVLHPDAAMAEGPVGFAEKLPLRGIVQINVILVGEVELYPAQRIIRPRFLNDLQGVAGFQAKMVAAQIAVILLDFGQNIGLGNAYGHVPGGVEDNLVDLGFDDRRFAVGFAHHHLAVSQLWPAASV